MMSTDDALKWVYSHFTTLGVPVMVLVALVGAAVKHKEAFQLIGQAFGLIFGGKEERERRRTRNLFARTLHGEIERIDRLNDWSDDRFAQLEAEVEVESFRAWWLRALRPLTPATTVRRERSLSRVLRRSREQLIILEGEPGAGKSVAMRRVALEVLARALLPLRLRPRLPVYVNLRDLVRPEGVEVNAQFIADFVRRCLNRTKSNAIHTYLETWFADEMATGGFLFLFDSFDEIPEVLASTAADDVVASYAQAIRDFCVTMSTCRAVIASREYRGPRALPATRVRVLRLSLDRQLLLVRRFGLNAANTQRVEAFLGDPGAEMRPLVENPMFLALVCNRMALDGILPAAPREVFSSYVETRIKQFRVEIRALLGPRAESLRAFAQSVAFEMGVNTSLGLSPSRTDLLKALGKRATVEGFTPLGDDGNKWLDALERAKIGRPGDDPEHRAFTFVHRRFQEFFAAERLLADSTQVPPTEIISNARWREAAVALLQTQDADTAAPLVAAARNLLEIEAQHLLTTSLHTDLHVPYAWQPGTLHVLGILDAAYAGRTTMVPAAVTEVAFFVLGSIRKRGTILDLKWILEIAGFLPGEQIAQLFPRGEELDFDVLRDTVLRTLGKLPKLDNEIRGWVHRTILKLAVSGDLARRKWTLRSQLKRLKRSESFFQAMRLVSVLRVIQALIFIVPAAIIIGAVGMHAAQIDENYRQKIASSDHTINICAACINQCISFDNWSHRYYDNFTKSEQTCFTALPCAATISDVGTGPSGQAYVPSQCSEALFVRKMLSVNRYSSAQIHLLVGAIMIVFVIFGTMRRGAILDTDRWLRALAYRLAIGLLILMVMSVNSITPAGDGTVPAALASDMTELAIVFTILGLMFWSEGAAVALLSQRGLGMALWPLYTLGWVWVPFGILLRRSAQQPTIAVRHEPTVREQGVYRVAIWTGSLLVLLLLALVEKYALLFTIAAFLQILTIGIMWGWLVVHGMGHVNDLVVISRALGRHGTSTMSVTEFFEYLFTIRGAAAATAFVEAVERYQLVPRGDRHWRALAMLPGIVLEDRERLARLLVKQPSDRRIRPPTGAERLVAMLVLDESFGASAWIIVRFLGKLRKKRSQARFVSCIKDLPSDEGTPVFAMIRYPWQPAVLGRRGAAALVRLSDQIR